MDDKKTIEQLHAELTHAQTEATRLGTALADACAARDALAKECNMLEEEREYNASLVLERDAKLMQAQKQLAKAETHRCAYCNYRATGADAFNVVAEHIKSCPAHPFAKALTELAQARDELKDLQGANRALVQQLTDVTNNRDYWHETCLDAEAERNKARQDAQDQSNEVQERWLTERQLRQEAERHAEALAQLVNEETAELLKRLGKEWQSRLDDREAALKLAAEIREALDEH